MSKPTNVSVSQLVANADRSKHLAEFYEERATRLSGTDKSFAEADAATQRAHERAWRAQAAAELKREPA